MATNEERAQDLHDKIEPEAQESYFQYILTRTPPDLQDEMRVIIEADFTPEPPPANQVVVSDGQTVPVTQQNGDPYPGAPGVLRVVDGALTRVEKTMAASSAIISSGQSVRVTLAGGGDAPGSPGSAAVVAGNLDFVQLG